jgi:hypothetical protein
MMQKRNCFICFILLLFSDVFLKFGAILVVNYVEATRINTLYILYRKVTKEQSPASSRDFVF